MAANIIYRDMRTRDWKAGALDAVLDACGVKHAYRKTSIKWGRDIDRLWWRRIQVTYIAIDKSANGLVVGFITLVREICGYNGEYSLYVTDCRVMPQYRDENDQIVRGLINIVVRHGIADLCKEIYAVIAPEYETIFRTMLFGDAPDTVLCRTIPWGELVKSRRRTKAKGEANGLSGVSQGTHSAGATNGSAGGGDRSPPGEDVGIPAAIAAVAQNGAGGPVDALRGGYGGTTGSVPGGGDCQDRAAPVAGNADRASVCGSGEYSANL